MNASTKASSDLVREARRAGVIVYDPPDEALSRDGIDPLLRKAVARFNECGWSATSESCQGHPDAVRPDAWSFNVEPMLRLLCRGQDAGRLLAALAEAARQERHLDGGDGPPVPEHGLENRLPPGIGMRVYVQDVPAGWFSVIVYLQAKTIFERDQGCAAFGRLAELVNR